jgi:predicted XRE-type DNA-binding protein
LVVKLRLPQYAEQENSLATKPTLQSSCTAALPFQGDAFRVVYAVQLADEIWVVHAFQKKSTQGIQDAATRNRPDKGPIKEIEGDVVMKSEKLEVVRGSGNVFRDLGHKNADTEQFKAILAAEIIKALDRDGLTVRAAPDRRGIAVADFSRIRNANLGRFTLDRLISILTGSGRVWS